MVVLFFVVWWFTMLLFKCFTWLPTALFMSFLTRTCSTVSGRPPLRSGCLRPSSHVRIKKNTKSAVGSQVKHFKTSKFTHHTTKKILPKLLTKVTDSLLFAHQTIQVIDFGRQSYWLVAVYSPNYSKLLTQVHVLRDGYFYKTLVCFSIAFSILSWACIFSNCINQISK